MKWFKSRRVVVFLIVACALFLRLYRVDRIPPSLSWDEVSIGYNAYSILTTGRDEHGRFLPLDSFIGYGDYKPPLPVYLTVPFVAVFGLSEIAVRLPSVLAGALTVLFTYILVKEMFSRGFGKDAQQKSQDPRESYAHTIAVIAAALLTISPWHLQLSRAGFEANIATLFLVVGVWLAIRAQLQRRYLLWCWLPFVAAMYTFNSSRYFAPMLVAVLVFFGWRSYVAHRRWFAAGIVISLLFVAPLVPHLASKEARLRFEEVNIFTDYSIVFEANKRIEEEGYAWWAKVFHNRRVGFARSYLIHFLDNLQPWFLFLRGDGNPKFSTQEVGQLYLIEAPFLILGALYMFATYRRIAWFLLLWLLLAIVPAATARETPHALRIETSLPVWQIVIAYGILSFYTAMGQAKRNRYLFAVFFLYLASFGYFLHAYYAHYAKEYSSEWQYGYREALRAVSAVESTYDTVVITERIGRPYMYVLFYTRYDPRLLWTTKDALFDGAGFYNVYGFGKYRFTREGVGSYRGRVLYVLPPEQVPENARIIDTVYLLNGTPALVIFDL